MEIPTLVSVLDHPHQAADHLHPWNLCDLHRAQKTLCELADLGLTLDLLAELCDQLGRALPGLTDPDAVLDALRRYLLAARSPLALGALFQRDSAALPMLLRAFSLGEQWREVLVADPEAFDRLRMTDAQPLARAALVSEAAAEVRSLADERSIGAALRRFRDRESLRITYGEVILRHKVELVAEQLTFLAEALLEAALEASQRRADQQRPLTRPSGVSQSPIAMIALGRLGAAEMDFSKGLQLLLIHDPAGETEAARKAAQEYGERVGQVFLRLMSAGQGVTPLFHVRLISLPDSQSSSVMHWADDVLLGFDSFGRSWHRQAMLKARPVAGDQQLASELLQRLEPWLYRRYLNQADETGIKALRRRLLRRAADAVDSPLDPSNHRGGLGDIVGAMEFLQLLAGGDRIEVRMRGTHSAIAELELAGVLSIEERTLLESNYLWLLRLAHRLQIGCGTESTALPTDKAQLDKIASDLGQADGEQLAGSCRDRLVQTWELIARLLQAAIADDDPPPVVDLLLDPAPSQTQAATALAGYGFVDPLAAAGALTELAREHNPFLSTRRCRHFLSLIAERMLQVVAVTPDPDRTLIDLVRISNSLGGKGVLWELFSFHPASLQLYVRLCAASPYLAGILTANPGMIDDLIDSLQLDRLPTQDELARTLAGLSRGAGDILPILHDLKNSAHLRIGVRDILGKDTIDATHAALADVAEFCLRHLIEREFGRLVEKHGQPTLGPGPFEGELCRPVILGLGKLGSREPNYHSSVEVVFLYEAEGTTRPAARSRQEPTTNNHFFAQLAKRVLKESSELTPKGRLATVDAVLRPIGVGGAMALPLDDFASHFLSGAAPLWHWQALCQARVVFGEAPIRESAANLIRQLLTLRVWKNEDREELTRSRLALEQGAAELNLKRGRGGTLDIEFLVQMLQLRHAAESPSILMPGTQQALGALAAAGHLARDDAEYLGESYRFLRRIESGLRLLNTSARHDLPEDSLNLAKLALLLGQPNGDTIRDRSIILLAENRRRFERIVGRT